MPEIIGDIENIKLVEKGEYKFAVVKLKNQQQPFSSFDFEELKDFKDNDRVKIIYKVSKQGYNNIQTIEKYLSTEVEPNETKVLLEKIIERLKSIEEKVDKYVIK